jgi:DNA-binding CsgD family transcriptional regulator
MPFSEPLPRPLDPHGASLPPTLFPAATCRDTRLAAQDRGTLFAIAADSPRDGRPWARPRTRSAGIGIGTGRLLMKSRLPRTPRNGGSRNGGARRRKLADLTAALAEKDAALRHVLQHIEAQRLEVARLFLDGIEELVLPPLLRLKDQVSPAQRRVLDGVIGHLNQLGLPFVERLGRDLAALSPTERRICSLVRQGLSVKEIAAAEGIAASTVATHRRSIRRKLGLDHTRVNLASMLAARPDVAAAPPDRVLRVPDFSS